LLRHVITSPCINVNSLLDYVPPVSYYIGLDRSTLQHYVLKQLLLQTRKELTFVEYPDTTMPRVFRERVGQLGDRACVAYKNNNGEYVDISWNEMNDMVRNLGLFFLSRGIARNDKIALFAANRFEWWVADLAILSIGAVNVPIYATNSASEAEYIISNSDTRICLVGTEEQLGKILEARANLPELDDVIVFDHCGEDFPGVTQFRTALDEGRTYDDPEEFDRQLEMGSTEDLATIIYTSGTTGEPKGVMLSHRNLLVNVLQSIGVHPEYFDEEHTFLSFLPLSHGYERIVGFYIPIYGGNKVVFAESFAKVLQNFQEVRPTFIVSVPRLYEKIRAGILAKVDKAPALKKALFTWAMGIARKNLPYKCNNRSRRGLFALQYRLADRLVFSKLKEALGMDRIALAFSGGGALSVPDLEFFLGMDMNVLEGYGLTEASPSISTNLPHRIKPGTIGPPLEDTQIKISDTGELLVKGPQIMMGYYKDPAATEAAFTEDGFLRTGDMAEEDEDGFIRITGRLKDIIITSGGKNIAPQNIESSLITSPFIEQAAVIGENRKFLSALVVPEFKALENWCRNQGLTFDSRQDMIHHEKVIRLFESEIKALTGHFAQVMQIRRFMIMYHEWSQETGELTPTLKIKRDAINRKYADHIEELYADAKT